MTRDKDGAPRAVDEAKEAGAPLAAWLGAKGQKAEVEAPAAAEAALAEAGQRAAAAAAAAGISREAWLSELIAAASAGELEARDRAGRQEGPPAEGAPASARSPRRPGSERNAELAALEDELERALGLSAKIKLGPSRARGTLTLRFERLEELRTLLERLKRSSD
ncbi:MAG TPA: hypothetical protein VN980_00470 [Alphaproteobacteria bacterium]|nr:hypothetical protein [Alphaproteobacteria bacterium]